MSPSTNHFGQPGPGAGWPLVALMLNAPLIGVRVRWPNVLHAVEMDGLPIKTWPNGTARSACGLTGLRLLAATWEESGATGPSLWPPRIAGMPAGVTRCADCHEATGRKRPRSNYVPKEIVDAA